MRLSSKGQNKGIPTSLLSVRKQIGVVRMVHLAKFVWETLQKLVQKQTERFLVAPRVLYHLAKIP
mgnify:CR=1 FL=1